LNKQGKNSYGIREELKMWFVNLEVFGSFGISPDSNDESTLGSDNKQDRKNSLNALSHTVRRLDRLLAECKKANDGDSKKNGLLLDMVVLKITSVLDIFRKVLKALRYKQNKSA
jgi:hypothetical protein